MAETETVGSLGPGAATCLAQPGGELIDLRSECDRNQIEVEQLDGVGRGVVQPRHEPGGVRDVQTQHAQVTTDGRSVQHVGEYAGVHLTGLAAAGTAVETCCVRVVRAVAAVPAQQHDRCEAPEQTHCRQHPLGDGSRRCRIVVDHGQAGSHRTVGGVEAVVFPMARRMAVGQALLHELGAVDEPDRFDEAEHRRRVAPKRAPPLPFVEHACPLVVQVGIGGRARRHLAHHHRRGEQTG